MWEGFIRLLLVFLFFYFPYFAWACSSQIDAVLCIESNGDVVFQKGFINDVKELGFDASSARSGSGGSPIESSVSEKQLQQLNNNAGDSASNQNTAGDSGNNQAASNGDLGGGNNGFGAGGQAAGFNNNGSSDLIGDSADTFEGFNNFDGSEDGGEKKSTLEVSPVLGKAINEQGSKRGIASDNSADGGGRGLQDSDSPQLAAAYNNGGGRGYAGSSAKGQAYGKDSSGKEGGNSIVSQAANFVKGAFGIGGSKNGRRRGSGKNYGSVGKSKSMRLAMNKTKSPEQVLKEKWARMRRAGYVGRRGVASTAPRGMLDVRVNIFHGMCKEYSVFASEIGSKDSGYCPPAR